MPNTWDYQWFFTNQVNSGLTALPNVNLVSNVGFGDDATHTSGVNIKTTVDEGMDAIRHPSILSKDVIADRYTFYSAYFNLYRIVPRRLIRLLNFFWRQFAP